MKYNLLIGVCLLATLSVHAATNVQGIITGNITWTKANSPYVLSASLLVDEQGVLTIEPGVEIIGEKGRLFYIDGILFAKGTSTDRIVFRSAQMSGKSDTWWDGIKFRGNKQQVVELEYCDFSYVYQLDGNYREFHINDCTFDHMIYGVRTGEYFFEARNNRFTNCFAGISGGNMQGEIANNVFSECDYGIDISSTRLSDYLKITQNEFIDNNMGMKCSGNHNGATPEIINNKFVNNAGALRMYYGHHQNPVRNNLFAYNKTGLYFDEGTGDISYNTFKYNNLAVVFDIGIGGLSPVLEYNCFEYSEELDVKFMYSSIDVNMRNNYWGTSDSAIIRSRIHDYFTDFTQPKAFYMPVLNAPDSSCQSVVPPTTIPDLEAQVPNVAVYPNPAADYIIIDGAEGSTVSISNMVGQQVYSGVLNNERERIDIAALSVGNYILKLTDVKGTRTKGKIVKQ